jgi:SAM-dependent methyltransferase
MDYDKTTIPGAYDAGRSHTPAALEFWLRTISVAIGRDQIADILDLGCGAGRFSAGLASYFGARVVGADPSEKMLAEARKKGGDRVAFLRGVAEATPAPIRFSPDSTMRNSLADWPRCAATPLPDHSTSQFTSRSMCLSSAENERAHWFCADGPTPGHMRATGAWARRALRLMPCGRTASRAVRRGSSSPRPAPGASEGRQVCRPRL